MEIRFLTAEDVGAYRELRLQALQESPTAFGSSYEQEICLSLTEFAARIGAEDANRFICGAFDDRQQLIGMLGFSRDRLKRYPDAQIFGIRIGHRAVHRFGFRAPTISV